MCRAPWWAAKSTCLVEKTLHAGRKEISLCWIWLTWNGSPQRSQVEPCIDCTILWYRLAVPSGSAILQYHLAVPSGSGVCSVISQDHLVMQSSSLILQPFTYMPLLLNTGVNLQKCLHVLKLMHAAYNTLQGLRLTDHVQLQSVHLLHIQCLKTTRRLLCNSAASTSMLSLCTSDSPSKHVSIACCVCAGTPPPARSAHAAAAWQSRYLLVFGGGSVANCFNDLYVLDTESMHWFCPPTQGPLPAPRAGNCLLCWPVAGYACVRACILLSNTSLVWLRL